MTPNPAIPKLRGYKLFDIIGQGGFGIVYDAIDLNSGYKVAVKKLHDIICQYPQFRQLFQQEANLYLYLQHDNIAKLTDFIIRDGKYYLVTEFIEGEPLKDFIRSNGGPLPLKIALNIIIQTLDAIDYAHKQEVLHLDIKPGNIMVLSDNRIKILDFGISKAKGIQYDSMNITGSPRYMSPEQINRKPVDRRTDIYMIGLVLYEMVTGTPPFNESRNQDDLFARIKRGNITNPIAFNPNLPESIIIAIKRSIAVNPNERYINCLDLKKALSKI